METFHLYCETCAFEREIDSLEDALEVEIDHKAQHGSAHQVTIERQDG
ncbi:hypothetical protein GRX03_07450 [Halovenus sp. WSH3]|uniref:Uncharacterized protein n=1 Tax=Halovenus carboxidivorans TaxID=2692199 RepID=A0A6B0T2T2_9EURY|nr:hypothetical protein [Halovenus carboxidivorans]MXR51437.1 hypothetical protein [Halovenus carboxidivorans]